MAQSFFRIASLVALALFQTPCLWAAESGAPTNGDDPSLNMQGVVVNRILKVLQTQPVAASSACLDALKAMHEANDQLGKEDTSEHNQDMAVARDLASSAMEDVTTMCGADAHTLCRSADASRFHLEVPCAELPRQP